MNNFQIRKAKLEDASDIASVHIESWKTTYKGIVSANYLNALHLEERKEKWKKILSGKHETFIAVVPESKIIGFASVGKERTGTYEGELYAIYLLDEYQRKGIGKSLVRCGMEKLKQLGMSNMLVWVLKDNPSRHFYNSLNGRLVMEDEIDIGGQVFKEEGILFPI